MASLDYSTFGNNWYSSTIKTSGSTGLAGISTSSTGQYITAAYNDSIYVSSDYGSTWTRRVLLNSSEVISDVAISESGQMQLFVTYFTSSTKPGIIYKSNDYGTTWNAKVGYRYFNSIAMSASGEICISASDFGGATSYLGLYISYNSGNNWLKSEAPTYASFDNSFYGYYDAAISSSGQYITGVTKYIYIWYSNNYGKDWKLANAPEIQYYRVAMSSSGQYQTAITFAGGIYYSINYGVDWIQSNAISSQGYWGISISLSGQYQVVNTSLNKIFVSSNYGATWTLKYTNDFSIYGLSIASNGNYILTLTGYNLLKSVMNTITTSGFGDTWVSTQIQNQGSLRNFLSSITGEYQMIVYKDSVYISKNFGISFSSSSSGIPATAVVYGYDISGNYVIISIYYNFASTGSISSSGDKMVVATSYSDQYELFPAYPTGRLYQSSDYGLTWTQLYNSTRINHVAISSDGSTIVATQTPHYLSGSGNSQYYSTSIRRLIIFNSFYSGTITTLPVSGSVPSYSVLWNYVHAAVSSSGAYITACSSELRYAASYTFPNTRTIGSIYSNNGYLYRSSNYGQTWTQVPLVLEYRKVEMSESGQYQIATTNTTIYKSSDYGVNWSLSYTLSSGSISNIKISPSGTNLVFTTSTNDIYVSINGGNTWISKYTYNNSLLNINNILPERNYIYILASNYNLLQSNTTRLLNYSTFGNSWKYIPILGTSGTPSQIAVSSASEYKLAIYNSSVLLDNGNGVFGLISTIDPSILYTSAAISRFGEIMLISALSGSNTSIPGFVYESVNYGSTWTKVYTGYFSRVKISENGLTRIACDNSNPNINLLGLYIYHYLTYPSWTKSTAPTFLSPYYFTYYDAAVSSCGRYIAATTTSQFNINYTIQNNSGFIVRSSNYGTTWNYTNISPSIPTYFRRIAMSSSGNYLTIIPEGSGYGIYYSNDMGISFIKSNAIVNESYLDINMSSTGQYQVVNTVSNKIYVSLDYGVSWTLKYTHNTSLSSLVVSTFGDYIYSLSGTNILQSTTFDTSVNTIFMNTNDLSYNSILDIDKIDIKNEPIKYCKDANCQKSETQKNLKKFNTSTNTTKQSKSMRYAQYIRQNSPSTSR
jgi:photosystem II stability/assembly factor-like uncharacterized protein